MSGVGYFIKCVKGLNLDEMAKTAKYLSKKTGKNRIAIFIDMVYCGIRFKAGYNDYREFEFYLINNQKRATYLTRCLNNDIIKKYNDKSQFPYFDDKITFNKEYNEFIKRDWLDLSKSTPDDLKDFSKNRQVIIVKPSDGQCGKGVEKINIDKSTDFNELYNRLTQNHQLLVEECVDQHDEMSKLNPTSVNTLRMFTFCDEKGAHLLQTILKIGNGGPVDNFYNGGMYTFVDKDGVVTVPAIDKSDKVYNVHPYTGTSIVGFQVPMMKEAEELVKKAAMVRPGVGYVGWDMAISKNGPLIIEGNAYPGIFQPRASFSKNGEGILPLYRQYMNI